MTARALKAERIKLRSVRLTEKAWHSPAAQVLRASSALHRSHGPVSSTDSCERASYEAPEGREVVIIEAVHTRSTTDTSAGVEPAHVEDAIPGCVAQCSEQGLNVTRNAWLQEGLPIETPGTTVNRQCGSAR